jgi:carnosine N-methyltransferase
MLFASNFIINCSERRQQFTIFPFVGSANYYYNEEDAYRSVTIPDLAPAEEIKGEPEFNITGGEFTFVYSKRPEYFEGVATCFFLDTANNIFDYVNTIWTTLKKGGIWVNFGPLLFHYKEMLGEVSIEVSWETLRLYISKCF